MLLPDKLEFGTNIADGSYYIERSDAGAKELTRFAVELYVARKTIQSLMAKNIPAGTYLDHFDKEYDEQRKHITNNPAYHRITTVINQWVLLAVDGGDKNVSLASVTYGGKGYGYLYQLVSGPTGPSNAQETVIHTTEDSRYLRVTGFKLAITVSHEINSMLEYWAREGLGVDPYILSAYARIYYPLHETVSQTAEGHMVMIVPRTVVQAVVQKPTNPDTLARMLNGESTLTITLPSKDTCTLHASTYDQRRYRNVCAIIDPVEQTVVRAPVLADVFERAHGTDPSSLGIKRDRQLAVASPSATGPDLAVYNKYVYVEVKPTLVRSLVASQYFLQEVGSGGCSTLTPLV